ncbi:amidohydrolase family protein [Paremcibacter congregatus]|uniref:metal-dependent hydrolase family protein n=1 Tax=Paremcibacter congregatus TaxID=2043170 RepID=UPI003A92AAA6
MEPQLSIRNATVFDGHENNLKGPFDIILAKGRIAEVGRNLISQNAENVIDAKGKTVMPGLIDAHFHAYATDLDFTRIDNQPMSYLAHPARELMENALKRGFTTVRDVAGAEYGLWKAIEERLFQAPRLFYGGKGLSQTGGHGDNRMQSIEPCNCTASSHLTRVVDGVDAVRKAVREELRRGAHHIKVFVSGGISTPSDPIWGLQYSMNELEAIVDEAHRRRTYVVAHAYTAEAIKRAVIAGVRTIEHGNLIDEEAAGLMAEKGVYLVPTLVTYEAIAQHGKTHAAPESMLAKLQEVREAGVQAIDICRKAGVKIGFGTDLLGELHEYQLDELMIRQKIDTPFDTLHSATAINAEIIGMKDKLGCIRKEAYADLLIIEGNPLNDISILANSDTKIVIKDGVRI